MNGIERIAKERQRQIVKEGFDESHDARNNKGQLAVAAACYAAFADLMARYPKPSDRKEFVEKSIPAIGWPFQSCWWKPSSDPVRNLEKAGALIAAEIDRLILEDVRHD